MELLRWKHNKIMKFKGRDYRNIFPSVFLFCQYCVKPIPFGEKKPQKQNKPRVYLDLDPRLRSH